MLGFEMDRIRLLDSVTGQPLISDFLVSVENRIENHVLSAGAGAPLPPLPLRLLLCAAGALLPECWGAGV
jgi:hypothetical protein